MTDPQEQERHGTYIEADGPDAAPPLKRKKTVTWAGDVPDTSGENEAPAGMDAADEGPAVVVVADEQGGQQDMLFAGLDVAALLGQQGSVLLLRGDTVDVPPPATEPLGRQELLQHRITNIDKLYALYQAEMWSLYDELHHRHRQFKQQQEQQQSRPGRGGGGSEGGEVPAGQPPAADVAGQPDGPSAGEEQEQQEQQEQQEAKAVEPVDLRELLKDHLRRRQELAATDAAGTPSQPEGAQQAAGGDGGSGAAATGELGAGPAGSAQPQTAPQGPQASGTGSGEEGGIVTMEVVDLSQEAVPQEQPQQQPQQQPQEQPQEQQQAEAQQAQPLGPQPSPSPQEGGSAGDLPAATLLDLSSTPGLGEEGECEEPVPLFEEMEALITGLGADSVPAPAQRLREQRAAFLRHLALIGRLEQGMLGALCRELDSVDAIAALCGRRQRYLLRRTAVLLGRNTESHGKVDVDLSGEGHAQTVSRQQAALSLEPDGTFRLRCLGRRNVFVNGRQVEQGGTAQLLHLSLIKVGGVSLLFLVNHAAVARALRRSAALSV